MPFRRFLKEADVNVRVRCTGCGVVLARPVRVVTTLIAVVGMAAGAAAYFILKPAVLEPVAGTLFIASALLVLLWVAFILAIKVIGWQFISWVEVAALEPGEGTAAGVNKDP